MPFDRDGGWVLWNDANGYFQGKYSVEDLVMLVHHDSKGRFELRGEPSAPESLEVRCIQGHSIREVFIDQYCEHISPENVGKYPVCVHGSYMKFWDSIRDSGLDRRARNHLHCAMDRPDKVKSGARADADIYIYIDLERAVRDGKRFMVSSNGVILSPDSIPSEYFSRVVSIQEDGSEEVIFQDGKVVV